MLSDRTRLFFIVGTLEQMCDWQTDTTGADAVKAHWRNYSLRQQFRQRICKSVTDGTVKFDGQVWS